MDLSDDFRIRARRCLALAGAAPTIESQTHWLSMAQLWFSMAQHAEERDVSFLRHHGRDVVAKPSGEKDVP
jgi:hypothetical protein